MAIPNRVEAIAVAVNEADKVDAGECFQDGQMTLLRHASTPDYDEPERWILPSHRNVALPSLGACH